MFNLSHEITADRLLPKSGYFCFTPPALISVNGENKNIFLRSLERKVLLS